MRAKKVHVDYNSEFELDLAPLLAVMVKLVPVLLVSSAFMQMAIIETDLPQVVQEAIQRQENQNDKTAITLEVSNNEGVRIVISQKGQSKADVVPMKDGQFDLVTLHAKLQEVKKSYPDIFKVDLKPAGEVAYENLVRIMDEARKSRNQTKFPVFDSQTGKNVETEYMFPEIVFVNTLEG